MSSVFVVEVRDYFVWRVATVPALPGCFVQGVPSTLVSDVRDAVGAYLGLSGEEVDRLAFEFVSVE